MELTSSINEKLSGGKGIKMPNEDEIDEILSYGLIVKENPLGLRFKHRSFAEFFYVKAMTDLQNTPGEHRSALFAYGYEVGNNVAQFLSNVVEEDEEATQNQFGFKGWTEFVSSDADLSKYVGGTTWKFRDFIFVNTIEYDKKCEGKNQLLVRDTYTDKLFVRWVSEMIEDNNNKEWVQNTLLQESMNEVLAAIVFSEDEEIQNFVNNVLLCSADIEERVKEVLKKCPCIIQIAVKRKYRSRFQTWSLCSDKLLIEQMLKWLTLEEVTHLARECMRTDGDLMNIAFQRAELCSFFASVLQPEELFTVVENGAVAIEDYWRC